MLDDEPLLLLTEDCLVQVPSADTVLCVLEGERGEGPAAACDRMEAAEGVRESAIDESRRVRGDGESSSSLQARGCKHKGERGLTRSMHIPIAPP